MAFRALIFDNTKINIKETKINGSQGDLMTRYGDLMTLALPH